MNTAASPIQDEKNTIDRVNKNADLNSGVRMGAFFGYFATLGAAAVMQDPASALDATLSATNALSFAAFVATLPVHVYLGNKRKNLENQFIQSHGTPREKKKAEDLAKEQSTNIFQRALSFSAVVAGCIAARSLAVVVTDNPSMGLPAAVVAAVLGATLIEGIAQKTKANRLQRKELVDDIAQKSSTANTVLTSPKV